MAKRQMRRREQRQQRDQRADISARRQIEQGDAGAEYEQSLGGADHHIRQHFADQNFDRRDRQREQGLPRPGFALARHAQAAEHDHCDHHRHADQRGQRSSRRDFRG